MGAYVKALAAFATAGLIALQVALADGTMTVNDWITVALAVVGAVTVYTVRNTDPDTEAPDWAAGSIGRHELRDPPDPA